MFIGARKYENDPLLCIDVFSIMIVSWRNNF